MHRARLLTLLLVTLLALPLVPAQDPGGGSGTLYRFNVTRYNDTLFASVDTAYRAVFDDAGDVWYTTPSGVVHLDLAAHDRQFFTHQDGLPSSLSVGLAARGDDVYAGTDLGLAVIHRSTSTVTPYTLANSPLPDDILHEVVTDGPSDVWIGTHFGGVALWNTSTDHWTVKNTSTTSDYAKPVRRIVPTPTAVWVGTDGDGVWKMDRATGNWSVLVTSDGLPSNTVLSILDRGTSTFFGTDKGLVEWSGGRVARTYNETSGMPDDRAHDIDLVETVDGGADLFVATREGLWQLHAENGNNTVRDQSFGILGAFIYDDTYSPTKGWVFATSRGISLLRDDGWTYYATGGSTGASPGPHSFLYTAVHSSPDSPYVWAGGADGLAAFEPATIEHSGRWFNFAEWLDYPGGTVNAIKAQGSVTWLGTTTGAYGFDTANSAWISRHVANSRNIVYGLDTDGDELWLGLFGEGVIMENTTTGLSRNWTYESLSPIPDQYITDLRIAGDTVWLGASIGAFRLDRLSGTFTGTYTTGEGIPGDGVVFRVLPDGPVTWIGTKDGGVARLDVASGRVDRVWNGTNVPGYHDDEVRSLYREGSRLWAGTKEGLLRIDVQTGQVQLYNQSNSKLVQNYVGGITAKDGILYLATASGVARLDLATDEFLPMRDAVGAQHGTNSTTRPATPVTVRIDAPRDGVGVAGLVEVRGAAFRLGAPVDRVEVRVGLSDWQRAQGTSSWNFTFDASALTPGEPVVVAARAIAGTDVSREAAVTVTPVAIPQTPLHIDHVPVTNASASRPIGIAAAITGDEPLSATLYYRVQGRDIYTALPMKRQGATFSAIVPFKDVQEGSLPYYIVAKSGFLEASDPEDPATQPHVVAVGPPLRVAVAIEAPANLTVQAGNVQSVPLKVTNAGSEAGTYKVTVTGIHASWVRLPPDSLTLGPGETRTLNATIDVPLRAFADNTTVTFEAGDVNNVAEPSSAAVPIEILASGFTSSSPPPARSPTPALAVPASLAVAALVALAAARRRSRP